MPRLVRHVYPNWALLNLDVAGTSWNWLPEEAKFQNYQLGCTYAGEHAKSGRFWTSADPLWEDIAFWSNEDTDEVLENVKRMRLHWSASASTVQNLYHHA
eukprot:1157346-Pelagomonas_calceolata.AAC.11